MGKTRYKNIILRKILTIIFVVLLVIGLAVFVYEVYKSDNVLAYDLGENQKREDDRFITSFEEYKNLINEFDVPMQLNENDFNNNYYIASFQDYDKCSEEGYKTIDKVNYTKDTIDITIRVHNKCGWCKNHIALHLIKIDKISLPKKVNYEYVYDKVLECGTI